MHRHDHAERRKAQRKGRERGCWVFIPAEDLTRAGFDPKGPVPFYRTWADKAGRGGLRVRLYAEQH